MRPTTRRYAQAAVGASPPAPAPPPRPALLLCLILATAVTHTYGGCEFPSHWSGRWFQSGMGILQVNRTSIEKKGECYDAQGDKFVMYDRSDDCYRCMFIHEKHHSVLQYKETYCELKSSLVDLCYSITGDASLFSMFRKSPEPRTVPCPFKAAPFTFTYNRGSGECSNPPSRAESCTDDSRLVLKYQACPDIQSTESNVEELICVATWKEGSTRYLVGKLNQVSRRSAVASDEDQYRCFIYERAAVTNGNRVTYHVAQSGDATCNGLQSAVEGSRTLRLTTADSHHGRCRFPAWITDHHTWFSLDHSRTYKFSLRNATLRIKTASILDSNSGPIVAATSDRTLPSHSRHHNHNLDQSTDENNNSGASTGLDDDGEVRMVCHSILQVIENIKVQIVAHVTAGCDSGYICMVFHKRDSSVIEIQQSKELHENTDDACRYFDPVTTPHTTLIATTLHAIKCPHAGRYTVIGTTVQTNDASSGRKKRRQVDGNPNQGIDGNVDQGALSPAECLSHDYEALAIGCGNAPHDTMEFRSSCIHQPISAYTCHGSWQENNTYYLIASPVARKSTDALRYCLAYTFDGEGSSPNGASTQRQATLDVHHGQQIVPGADGSVGAVAPHLVPYTPPVATVMRLSGLSDTCHRHVVPGASGLWAFNFTTNGACTRAGDTGTASPPRGPSQPMLLLAIALIAAWPHNR